MLEPELKQRWIDALRSGKYQKGKEALKTKSGKFCCLGVLCEIENVPVVDTTPVTYKSIYKFEDGKKSFGYLHGRLAKAITETHMQKLAHLNDRSIGFEPVIKYIEDNL